MQKLDLDEEGSDVQALTLYDRHALTLYRYIYRRVSQPQDAEDVLLEAFTIAYASEKLSNLPAQQQIAWLQAVARRRIIDRYRRNARVVLLPLEQALEALDEDPTPEEQAIRLEAHERLYFALAQLPPIQQQLVRLRYGNGLPFAQIATMLDKPEGTVRKMLVRTLRQLRVIYNRQYTQEERCDADL